MRKTGGKSREREEVKRRKGWEEKSEEKEGEGQKGERQGTGKPKKEKRK